MIELRSPADRLGKLRAKMRQSIEQGVRLARLLDPIARRAEVYRPDQAPLIHDQPARLSSENVLDGLVRDVRGL